jgi:pimeloyl-ACP methyl ester carboxylesterase
MTTTNHTDFLADDLTVTIDENGNGRPVLLLHGGGGPQTMAGLPAALAEEFHVITPTHPGFALTPRPDWYDSIDDLALTYVLLLEQQDLDNVLVIGSSIGGWIAAELAVREHRRISATVLINAVGINVEGIQLADFFALTPDELAEHAFHNPEPFKVDPATLAPEAQRALAGNATALAAYAKDPYMHDPKLKRRLKLVSTPVLALWGESDQIAPPAYGQAYADSFPHARLELIAEAGHLPQIEQSQRTLDHIRRFASETDATPVHETEETR